MYIVNPIEMTNTHIKIRGMSNKPIVERKWNKRYSLNPEESRKQGGKK